MPITTSPDFGNVGRRISECRRRYGVLTWAGRRWLARLKGESRGWQMTGTAASGNVPLWRFGIICARSRIG